MYKIIGGDRQEHGPVSAQQILQWVAEGRAIASTPCKPEGAAEWRPLSELPEFAAAFASAGAVPPPIAPPAPAAGPQRVDTDLLASEILARGGDFSISHCLGRGWDLLSNHFWLLVGACFVGSLVWSMAPLFGVMMAGLFGLMLKLMRGQSAEFSDCFEGFDRVFVPTLLAGVLVIVLTSLGLALCIIPGIFLATVWTFTWPLLMDRKLSAWQAMEVSRKVCSQHFWGLLGLLVVNWLLMFAGACLCGVGMYIALPWTIAATAYAYEDIFNSPAQPAA